MMFIKQVVCFSLQTSDEIFNQFSTRVGNYSDLCHLNDKKLQSSEFCFYVEK